MSNKVYFLYPFEGPTTSIILRRPIFGDANALNVQTVVKHTRSGEIYTYARAPKYQQLKLTFEGMRHLPLVGYSGREQIKTFLALAAGGHVKFIDHRSVSWQGVIITPAVEFTNQGKDQNGDLFGFSLEFEGYPV